MGKEGRRSLKGNRLSFEFTFNGRSVTAYEEDTVASALVRAGVHVFSRSMKFHRPRGIYCGAGRCYSCMMRVNGIPGVRTCSTRAERGMVVQSERGFPSTRLDVLSLLDHVFRRQFEYNSRFIRPSFMVPLYQKMTRRLASSNRLPDAPPSFQSFERIECDILIVGHGVSGSAANARLHRAGIHPVVVDERGTDLDSPSQAFGFYDDGTVGVLTEAGGRLVKSRAILLATGRREIGIPLVNGDLPGVMLPRAIDHLAERGVKPGLRAVIAGRNAVLDEVARQLASMGTEVVAVCPDTTRVRGLLGRSRLSGLELLADGKDVKRIECDLLVILGAMVPEIALAQQAGCELVSLGGAWSIKVDSGNKTNVSGLFASGGSTGLAEESERRTNGELAAESIIEFLEGK